MQSDEITNTDPSTDQLRQTHLTELDRLMAAGEDLIQRCRELAQRLAASVAQATRSSDEGQTDN